MALLWPFMPQHGFTETLEWLTDVIVCKGAEQRQALRTKPRHGFSYTMLLDALQFSRAKALALGAGHQELMLPFWPELSRLGVLASGVSSIPLDAASMDLVVGDKLVLWQSDDVTEVVTVQTIVAPNVTLTAPTVAAFTDAYVAPARLARLSQAVSFERTAHDWVRASVEFASTELPAVTGSLGYPSHKGAEVMTARVPLAGSVQESAEREVELFDSGFGPIVADPVLNFFRLGGSVAWDTLTRAELRSLRRWLHSRQGRQKAFWTPSWNNDLQLTQDITSTGTLLRVKAISYPSLYTVRDFMILKTDGTSLFGRITGGAAGTPGVENLTLEAALGVAVAQADVEMVCFMTLSRFDADRIEIKHRPAQGASVIVPVTEIPA